ncbi:hypothetical protein [Sphingobacterium mizutaii]|uniref:hypothetical protein n=1 Tax=Sphingobacterium mizutaii TaxID=1010 RepID=UPI001627B139|nr:hypothetical protein [Sphingobacterium mizutaii]
MGDKKTINMTELKINVEGHGTEETKKLNNKETIKMDFPTGLYTKLEDLFINENSKVFKKVLFIVYLINQGTWNKGQGRYNNYYELSTNHMKGYLSLNKMMSPIMKKLVDNQIIKKSGIGIKGSNYTKYSMVERFDFSNMNPSTLTTIYLTKADGVYINKYITDDYIVKYAVNKTNKTEVRTPIKINKEVDVKIETVNATVEDVNMSEEIKNIKMTLQELMNKMTALENENAELRNALNNKADIVSTLKNEIQQYTSSRLEEPITFEKPDVVDVVESDDDKVNTPFFTDDEDDIDFGADLLNKVNALIAPDDDVDFTQIFDVHGEFEKPKITLESIKSPVEKQLNTVVKRHIKSAGDINKLVKFITANNDSLITAQQLLSTGVGMSGATANRLIDDLKVIQFSPN